MSETSSITYGLLTWESAPILHQISIEQLTLSVKAARPSVSNGTGEGHKTGKTAKSKTRATAIRDILVDTAFLFLFESFRESYGHESHSRLVLCNQRGYAATDSNRKQHPAPRSELA